MSHKSCHDFQYRHREQGADLKVDKAAAKLVTAATTAEVVVVAVRYIDYIDYNYIDMCNAIK